MAAALTRTARARELARGTAATLTVTASSGPTPAWALTLGPAAESVVPGSGMDVVPGPMIVVQRYEYTGRELASESAGYYFRFRVYGPELGQFFTRDPLGYVDGMSVYQGWFATWDGGVDPTGQAGGKITNSLKVDVIVAGNVIITDCADKPAMFSLATLRPGESTDRIGMADADGVVLPGDQFYRVHDGWSITLNSVTQNGGKWFLSSTQSREEAIAGGGPATMAMSTWMQEANKHGKSMANWAQDKLKRDQANSEEKGKPSVHQWMRQHCCHSAPYRKANPAEDTCCKALEDWKSRLEGVLSLINDASANIVYSDSNFSTMGNNKTPTPRK